MMNKETRKQIAVLIGSLSALADVEAITEAGAEDTLAEVGAFADELQSFADEERDKFDNMPEGLQSSERGQAMEEAADMLEAAVNSLQSIHIDFKNLQEGWQEEVMDEILSAISELEGI
jgi:hypothetical protein